MKVSIAVPSYNYGRYLEACLSSIQGQDYDNIEVLIADGGSTDDSLEIARKYCMKDSRFLVVSTEDLGQADAITKAFRFASGDLFGYLNADDCYICCDALSHVVATFGRYPNLGLVSFGGYYIDGEGRYMKLVRLRYHPFDSMAWMRYRTAVLQPATFWSRAVHEAIPLRKDFHFAFDAVFFYEAYRRFSWVELPKSIAGYRLHGENKSHAVKSQRVLELARFEQVKFGPRSIRYYYLFLLSKVVRGLEILPVLRKPLLNALYYMVNSLSFLTFHRLPSI